MVVISRIGIWFTIIIAVLVVAASLLGIFNPIPYARETTNWALQAVGQDIGNLIAIPVLLISLYFLIKGSVRAFFIWVGVLFYLIYAYLLYAFYVHFNYLFLVYVTILGLSVYSLIGGLWNQNLTAAVQSLWGKRISSASIFLIIIGGLFGTLWLSEIVPAISSGEVPRSAAEAGLWVNPVHVIDLALVLPGIILTGLLLWYKKQTGYLFAGPWLTFLVLMGCSILATMTIDLIRGNSEIIPPLVLMSIIVVSGTVILFLYLRRIRS